MSPTFRLNRSARHLASAAIVLATMQAHALTVDLGAASPFSALTFGSFTGFSGDTGSLLGVGGAASLTNWAVNAYGLPGPSDFSLIVGGDFTGNSGVVHGAAGAAANSWIGGTVITNGYSLGQVSNTLPAPLNFSALQTQLTQTSAATALTAATGSVDYAGGTTRLTGSNADVEVFHINGTELSADSYLQGLGGIKSGATVILNISGQNVSLNSFGIALTEAAQPQNLLLNFYEATSLSFSGIAVEGAVLAPLAAVTGTSGHIGGTFIAQSFQSVGEGNFEFHDINFTPVVVPSPVPESDTWMLMTAGLMVVPFLRRRRAAVGATADA